MNISNSENQSFENISLTEQKLFMYMFDILLLINLFISLTDLRNIQ